MTAIAGVVYDGKVYIGGDSAGVSGWDLYVRADAKVFTNGPFVMGFTSSFRMGQLLRYAFVEPARPEGVDDAAYMVTAFVDGVREALKAGGWAKTNSSQEEGGTFLVGYRGRLYIVYGDYQVAEPADGFAAVGCGDNQALGVLYATPDMAPEARINLALSAAERFSAGVRGPFVVVREP
jgi:ATP-dependent protease HslVU (ClpYQ) peptidase subunit